jgi:hypothetical protein
VTVQEMAPDLTGMTCADEEMLRSWSQIEDPTFEAYARQYRGDEVLICKGCHGG